MIMPAISIRQPWACAIILGAKDVENRTWPPGKHLGTRVLIHAGRHAVSKGDCLAVLRPAYKPEWFLRESFSYEAAHQYLGLNIFMGGIIGIATIAGCVTDSSSPWALSGCWHWLLADAQPLRFYPCKGRLRFFTIDYPYEVPA